MKKVFSFVAVAAMTVALFSCSEAEGNEETTGADTEQVQEEAPEVAPEPEVEPETNEAEAEAEGEATDAE
jgi:hypothetical protein